MMLGIIIIHSEIQTVQLRFSLMAVQASGVGLTHPGRLFQKAQTAYVSLMEIMAFSGVTMAATFI
ncbi:hypothetical protein P8775_19840 [Enterobacter cloacae]